MFQYAPAAAGATGVAIGARAFVPPAHGSNVTPYNEDFVPTPQQANDDNYYYSSTTPVGVAYAQHGDGEYYDNNAGYQAPVNNGYYGYPDSNDNQGYYNNEGYHDTGAKTYAANDSSERHADYAYAGENNDPHQVYSKPDARE